MPGYHTLISRRVTHARNANTNTKHDFPVGVSQRTHPPNLRLLLYYYDYDYDYDYDDDDYDYDYYYDDDYDY